MRALDDLIIAYTNEKSTTQLLPYNPLADDFSQMVKYQHTDPSEPQLVRTLRELEIERIKFFVKEYIIIRLQKLNNNIFWTEDVMSPREIIYYRKYLSLLDANGVLTRNESAKIEYVGFYCVKNLENVKIDNEIIEISEGDFFVANLDDVMVYLKRGHIVLV